MTPRIALATAGRVLAQLRRDPRTIALLLIVPAALVTLLRYVLGEPGFDKIGAPLVGLFPFITMFLVTSITMLRERTTGTLERLMTMPMAKLDLLLGYGIAFALVATVQSLITSVVDCERRIPSIALSMSTSVAVAISRVRLNDEKSLAAISGSTSTLIANSRSLPSSKLTSSTRGCSAGFNAFSVSAAWVDSSIVRSSTSPRTD